MDPRNENFTTLETVPLSIKNLSLPFWSCFILNSENVSFPAVGSNHTFYTCRLAIKYILHSDCAIGDRHISCGYWICLAVGAVSILLANFGLVTNILNLLILPKSLKGCTVKKLMVLLSMFDLLASICAIPATVLLLLILGRYENRRLALEAFRIFHLLFSLGRTGSIFVTIMITIERYIAVEFPFKQWLAPKKARVHLVILLILIALMNLPWWLSKKLADTHSFLKTDYDTYNTSDLSHFPYIYKGTAFAAAVYPYIFRLHLFIDFASPFPLLLIFNGLLYRSIYLSNKARQTLTSSQRREVNAAKMFSIVALMLLLCHSVAVAVFITSQVHRISLRELQFFQMLATTLNASINFIIYYAFGKSFRDEFWYLVRACNLVRNKVEMAAATPSSTNGSTIEMGVTSKTSRSVKTKTTGNVPK